MFFLDSRTRELVPDDAGLERARREAYPRTIKAFAPRWFVAFSSLGCLAASTKEVMKAMAVRCALCGERRQPGGPRGPGSCVRRGHGILHARWLPRLSAAIERGAWGRLRLLLRTAAGARDGDV